MSGTPARSLGWATLALLAGIGLGITCDRLWESHASHAAAPAEHDKPSADPPSDDEPETAALVRTTAAVQTQIAPVVEAFGVTATPPTAVIVESWPADVIITKLLIQPGAEVTPSTPIAQIAPTRDAVTQLAGARLAADSTSRALDLANERLDHGLTTRPEVQMAKATYDDARQKLDRLQASLPAQDGLLRAHSSGIVGTIRVQVGSTVPAGSPILDILGSAVIVQLGIDPRDADQIHIGQLFDLRPVDDLTPGAWQAAVQSIAPGINPATRLIDITLAFVDTPSTRSGLPLRGQTRLFPVEGVAIPRRALIPETNSMAVFVVQNGAAARHTVRVALATREQVILASGCEVGDHVVIAGQGQLTQGATVRESFEEAPPTGAAGDHGADH